MPDEVKPRVIEVRPQPKQALFLSNSADICIYGGARGGGKTTGMLMEASRHSRNKKFGVVWFRRSMPEIIREGGVWDEAHKLWSWCAKFNENEHTLRFYNGARITFAQIQYDQSTSEWLGAQIGLLCFDQLETFSEKQFFDLLAANRSMSGVRPYVRATCNPEPGWLCDFAPEKTGFLSYWISEDGYADLSKIGKIRYFVRRDGQLFWADTAQELIDKYPGEQPKSVSFIVSTVFDNQILLQQNPEYLASLMAQDHVTRERWLGDAKRGGNWKIREKSGNVFDRNWFKVIYPKDLPNEPYQEVRFWDLAATEKKIGKRDPDHTSGTKMRYYKGKNLFVIMDVVDAQIEPAATDELMWGTACGDGFLCRVRWEREGGASGVRDGYNIVTKLHGFDAEGIPSQGDKIQRAKPLATQAKAGNVVLLYGEWNESFKNQLHSFPEGRHDDECDSASSCFNCLMERKKTVRAL